MWGMWERIDGGILQATGKPVSWWCETTGKSNFALAKIMVCVSIACYFGAITISTMNNPWAGVGLLLFLGPAWFLLALPGLSKLSAAQREQENLPEGCMPIFGQYHYQSRFAAGIRFSLLLFALTGIPLWGNPNITPTAISDNLMVAGLLLYVLHLYIAAHFMPSGGSKLKELLRRLAQQFGKVKLPLPFPSPAA